MAKVKIIIEDAEDGSGIKWRFRFKPCIKKHPTPAQRIGGDILLKVRADMEGGEDDDSNDEIYGGE